MHVVGAACYAALLRDAAVVVADTAGLRLIPLPRPHVQVALVWQSRDAQCVLQVARPTAQSARLRLRDDGLHAGVVKYGKSVAAHHARQVAPLSLQRALQCAAGVGAADTKTAVERGYGSGGVAR